MKPCMRWRCRGDCRLEGFMVKPEDALKSSKDSKLLRAFHAAVIIDAMKY